MNQTDYNPRIICAVSDSDLEKELELIGVREGGMRRMVPKARAYILKLYNVPIPQAHVLKESFLSAGGDAAISREAMTGVPNYTDVILVGTRKTFTTAAKAIYDEQIGGPTLATEIETVIGMYESGPVLPDSGILPNSAARWLYSQMVSRTLVMGILNVTPDSFSDGGRFLDQNTAVSHGLAMIEDGADIIDVGGESTRPGSEPISQEEEIRRVIPVIKRLSEQTDSPISIDTYHASTAEAALDAGASIINDISGMSFDPDMKRLAAERCCPVILMHIKGTPRDMQKNPYYKDLMGEIYDYLRQRIDEVHSAGLDERLIIIDPGIGFGKTIDDNLEILRRLGEFKSLGRPILIGTSRKSTIGHVLGGLPPAERIEGTAATVAVSIVLGANIVRVHDVKQMARVAKMTDAIVKTK